MYLSTSVPENLQEHKAICRQAHGVCLHSTATNTLIWGPAPLSCMQQSKDMQTPQTSPPIITEIHIHVLEHCIGCHVCIADSSQASCMGQWCDWHHIQYPAFSQHKEYCPGKVEHQHAEGCLELRICYSSFQSYCTQDRASSWTTELLSFCGDLYNLQQPLCTLLMPVAVPRTDPAPSQGQGALIKHCELAQTGWTEK